MGTDYGTVQVRNPMGPGGHLQAGCGAPLLWEEQQGWPGSVWGREGIWPVQRPLVGCGGAKQGRPLSQR